MPTRQQMYDNWDFEMNFLNKPVHKQFTDFSGEVIGKLVWDEENQDIKIVPLDNEEENK